MATAKVKFRASARPDKAGSLCYRVVHKQSVKQILSGYRIYAAEWDPHRGRIRIPEHSSYDRKNRLSALDQLLQRDISRMHGIIRRFEESDEDFSAKHIVEEFLRLKKDPGFMAFATGLIDRLRRIGKERTAETYTTVLRRFAGFRMEEEILLEEMDSSLMVAFETHLKIAGCCPNTTSFYMRNLRAIYNRAVDLELTSQHFPFKHVYTGVDKTVKRAVPLKTIRRIRDLDLSADPAMDFARDMFMFSFYTRGMSFIDMAYLKKKDLRNGILTYRRQKTNQRLFIKWERPMQRIIEKYDTSETPYLLPIVRKPLLDPRKQYKNAAHLVHAKLRKLGMELNLEAPLTCYVARHTWASVAKSQNIPLAVISEAMGHDSERTTMIYLASLDSDLVDKANQAILAAL